MPAARRFKFGLQPALEKALARKQTCEEAFAEARRQLAAEQARLDEIRREIEQIRQRIASECDKSMSDVQRGVSAADAAGRRRFVDSLRLREQQRQAAAEEQRRNVEWAEQRLELRRGELAEALQAVDALEKYKDKAVKEHQTQQRKAEEREADDTTSMRWKG